MSDSELLSTFSASIAPLNHSYYRYTIGANDVVRYSPKTAPFEATTGRTIQYEAIYQRFVRLRPLYAASLDTL